MNKLPVEIYFVDRGPGLIDYMCSVNLHVKDNKGDITYVHEDEVQKRIDKAYKDGQDNILENNNV